MAFNSAPTGLGSNPQTRYPAVLPRLAGTACNIG